MTTSELIIAALRDGASALQYRAERLSDVAGTDEEAQAMVGQFRYHARVLTELADADEAQRSS